jgi:hypothetical protein
MTSYPDPEKLGIPASLVAVADRLGYAFRALTDDNQLIISVASSPRYMQFVEFDGALRGESVGDAYIADDAPLTDFDRAWLSKHGWNEPDEGGNYWRHWDPADPEGAATVAVVTLYTVHGVTEPGQLMFECADPAVMAELMGFR